MSGGSLAVRLTLTGGVAVVMGVFGLVVRGYTTEPRDPYLSARGWWGVIAVGAVGFLVTVFTAPFSRSGFALHLPPYVLFAVGLVRAVRGVGRVRLLLPALTGSPVSGSARPGDEAATAPFSGRSCCYCVWRVERDVSGAVRDRESYETVATGVVGGEFRVETSPGDDQPVDVRDATVVAADEETIPEAGWTDDTRRHPSVDGRLPTGDGSATRAVERRITPGEVVTVLPGVVYCGTAASVRGAVGRALVGRVALGALVAAAAAAVIAVTGCLPR